MKSQSDKQLSSTIILRLNVIYLVITIGIALQIGAGNWDIIWHGVTDVESFFSPPHVVLYAGVALVILTTLIGIIQFLWIKEQDIRGKRQGKEERSGIHSIINNKDLFFRTFIEGALKSLSYMPYSLKIITIGTTIEIFSGMFDNWWHNNFGFDGLLSPPHLMLTIGIMLSIYGALIGIYRLKKYDDYKNKNNNFMFHLSFIIAYAVTWMVSVNLIFMFSLPYSQGQYFDFNPNPLAAIIISTLLIPFVSAMIFLSATKTLKEIEYRFTLITLVFIIIHSTSTIISNNHFVMLYPLYLLNIIPALVADFILRLQNKNSEIKIEKQKVRLSKKRITIFTSAIVPIFFVTLFFPWSINVYKEYFQIDLNTFESIDIFNQLFWNAIIPFIIPVSILMSIFGSYLMIQILYKYNKLLAAH